MKSNIKLYIIGLLLLFILIILIFSKTYSNYKNYKHYKKKISLCFLIYDTLNHEELWHKWLKNVDKNKYTNGHQVEKYNKFINDSFAINSQASNLKLPNKKYSGYKKSKLLGINPGASFGSAKRWHPEKFAEVAIDLSNQFDIIIFGGLGEKDIAKDIEIC